MKADFLKRVLRKFQSWSLWFRVSVGIVGVGLILAAVAWIVIPIAIARGLEAELGKRSFPDIRRDANEANGLALSRLSPKLLVDIPATAFSPGIESAVATATKELALPDGVTMTTKAPASVMFFDDAIRMAITVLLTHPRWGTVDLALQVDAVPKIDGNTLVVTPVVTKVDVASVSHVGISLPSFGVAFLNEIVSKSLDALSSKINPIRVSLALPASLVSTVGAPPALLVTNKAVSALLGTSASNPKSLSAAYRQDFLASAQTILPRFEPGQGVIAAAGVANNVGMIAKTESMRDDATAHSLAVAERLAGMVPQDDLATLTADRFDSMIVASISSQWVSDQITPILLKIIADETPKNVTIDVRPQNVTVHALDGAIEVAVAGTASFAADKLVVRFSLSAWGTIHPYGDSLSVSYAPRSIGIHSLTINWEGRETAIAVPYENALGELLAEIIGKLNPKLIAIPPLPLKFRIPEPKGLRIIVNDTPEKLHLLGGSVIVSSTRIRVLAAAKLSEASPPAITAAPPSRGQFARLLAIAEKGEQFLADGTLITEQAVILVGKKGLASVMNGAWATLQPRVQATLEEASTFDAGEIKLISGDATCGNACQRAASCGDIGSCRVNVCHDVIAGSVCNTLCPGGRFNPLCREVCRPVTKTICGPSNDQSCVDRISACISGAAECLARWTSGLQATCEATLATLKGTGFTGLAKISGGMSATGGAETANTSGLSVAPDLSAVTLGISVVAHANIDAHVDVVFTDFGNFFGCPSGRLSANPSFTANLVDQKLSATITWGGNKAAPLVAHILVRDPTIVIRTAEPPLVTMVKNNPGLLLCGPIQAAIAPIVGLAVISSPHLTRELLADALRKALPGERGQIAAAVIDGEYRYTPKMPPIDFAVPSASLLILDKAFVIVPHITGKAVEFVLQ